MMSSSTVSISKVSRVLSCILALCVLSSSVACGSYSSSGQETGDLCVTWQEGVSSDLDLAINGAVHAKIGVLKKKSYLIFNESSYSCDVNVPVRVNAVNVAAEPFDMLMVTQQGNLLTFRGDRVGRAEVSIETEEGTHELTVNVKGIESTHVNWTHDIHRKERNDDVILLAGGYERVTVSHRSSGRRVLGQVKWDTLPPWRWASTPEVSGVYALSTYDVMIDEREGEYDVRPPGRDAFKARIVGPEAIHSVKLCYISECVNSGETMFRDVYSYRTRLPIEIVFFAKDGDVIHGEPLDQMRVTVPDDWKREDETNPSQRHFSVNTAERDRGEINVMLYGESYTFKIW